MATAAHRVSRMVNMAALAFFRLVSER